MYVHMYVQYIRMCICTVCMCICMYSTVRMCIYTVYICICMYSMYVHVYSLYVHMYSIYSTYLYVHVCMYGPYINMTVCHISVQVHCPFLPSPLRWPRCSYSVPPPSLSFLCSSIKQRGSTCNVWGVPLIRAPASVTSNTCTAPTRISRTLYCAVQWRNNYKMHQMMSVSLSKSHLHPFSLKILSVAWLVK